VRSHTLPSGEVSGDGARKMDPSTLRTSIGRSWTSSGPAGWSTPASSSAVVGTSSGGGASGMGSAWSRPVSGTWNEAIIDRIGWPCCRACVRRALNERTVAQAFDGELDGHLGVARPQEVGVQAVRGASGLDGPACRHQRLAQHLAAEDAAERLPDVLADEAVRVRGGLQPQVGDQLVAQGLRGRR
jgi:hypothetical protein